METVARWTAPDTALGAALPGLRARLAVMGAVVGLMVAAVLELSARRGGTGHINPAVSFGLWLLRALPGRAVVPFAAAQLAGSLTGAALARLLWGPAVSGALRYAALSPAPGWNAAAVSAVEAASTAALMLPVAAAVLRAGSAARFLPPVIGACVGAVIVLLGPLDGGGANPARQFGPALLSGAGSPLWPYLLGPLTGAALVTWPAGRRRAAAAGADVPDRHRGRGPRRRRSAAPPGRGRHGGPRDAPRSRRRSGSG